MHLQTFFQGPLSTAFFEVNPTYGLVGKGNGIKLSCMILLGSRKMRQTSQPASDSRLPLSNAWWFNQGNVKLNIEIKMAAFFRAFNSPSLSFLARSRS